MNTAIRVILTLIGAGFLAVSIVGLMNSDLDSRELLLVALGYGGAAFVALGIRQFILRKSPEPARPEFVKRTRVPNSGG